MKRHFAQGDVGAGAAPSPSGGLLALLCCYRSFTTNFAVGDGSQHQVCKTGASFPVPCEG